MNQISLSQTGFELPVKRARKRIFLDEMRCIIPSGVKGRPAFPVSIMLRIHFMQQWFGLSGPSWKGALHDVLIYCELEVSTTVSVAFRTRQVSCAFVVRSKITNLLILASKA